MTMNFTNCYKIYNIYCSNPIYVIVITLIFPCFSFFLDCFLDLDRFYSIIHLTHQDTYFMSSYWLLSEWRVLQIVIANFCFIYRQSPLSSFPYDIYMYNAIIGLVSILISQSSSWCFLFFLAFCGANL